MRRRRATGKHGGSTGKHREAPGSTIAAWLLAAAVPTHAAGQIMELRDPEMAMHMAFHVNTAI